MVGRLSLLKFFGDLLATSPISVARDVPGLAPTIGSVPKKRASQKRFVGWLPVNKEGGAHHYQLPTGQIIQKTLARSIRKKMAKDRHAHFPSQLVAKGAPGRREGRQKWSKNKNNPMSAFFGRAKTFGRDKTQRPLSQ